MLWAFLTGGDVTLYYSHSSHFQPSVSLRHILNTHSRSFRMYIKMLSDTAERTVTKLETQDSLTLLWRNPFFFFFFFICCCSFAQLCLTLCDPSTLGFQSFIISQSLLKLMCIELVMPSNHLTLCCPLLLRPSIFPIIRAFFNELLFTSGGQRVGASAPASVLPMNIQD